MAVHVVPTPEAHYLWTADSVRASQALAYISDSHWNNQGWGAPNYVHSDTLLGGIKVRKGVMQAGDFRLARVGYYKDAPLPSVAPTTPLPVDALLLQRGSVAPLSRVLNYYAPSMLILDASMGVHRKQQYKEDATVYKLPVYDIAEQGAYITNLSQ
jgi:hypothetical protein